MLKRLNNDFNYALFLPILLFYLISIGVQSMAAELDGVDVKNVVTKQIIFCVLSLIAIKTRLVPKSRCMNINKKVGKL